MNSKSLNDLLSYIESENYKGWDPYDTLNSFVKFKFFGTFVAALAIQFQKRNPVNIRPLLGIKKGYNPKGIGLLLKAYCILYSKTNNKGYLERADYLFNWLKHNYSKGYSGYAWGYNFDWASPGSYLKAYTPSVVVTSFVTDGIFEYYKITNDSSAREILLNAASYIRNDIPRTDFPEGVCFSYTHTNTDCCYNASLLAAEVLARANTINPNSDDVCLVQKAVEFVISKQKPDGCWYYSFNPDTNTERRQIDFHQGFVLVSLYNIKKLIPEIQDAIDIALVKGLEYYRENQFFNNGQSIWRIPKVWPVDIHNQSQGIITFTLLKEYDDVHMVFAGKISEWTINNMQSRKGYFYYKMYKNYKIRTPFMRWSQAWMLLAFAELMEAKS